MQQLAQRTAVCRVNPFAFQVAPVLYHDTPAGNDVSYE